MDDRYNYGGNVALVKKAAGVSGVLIKDAGGNFVFRVYEKKGEFTDYDFLHNDLAVTRSEEHTSELQSH